MKRLLINVLMIALLAGIISCEQKSQSKEATTPMSEQDKALFVLAANYFQPIPDSASNVDNPYLAEKIELGRMLYFDTRLSLSNSISCNSCHNLSTYGVDNNSLSVGFAGQLGTRNSPTVLNAALHFSQFWDGRAKDVEEQATGPVMNPVEMAMPHEEIAVERIASIPEYQDRFKLAFPDEDQPLTLINIGKAIGAFERLLLTPGPFDSYLKGDAAALNEKEKKGLDLFIRTGCIICHTGPALGARNFQKFGHQVEPYWDYTGSEKPDEGLFGVTGNEADKFKFKVPGLLNIARTYPYFHDGSVWDLREANRIIAKTQLKKDLTEEELDLITAWMQSLTGTIPADALQLPVLPPSTNKTPKPQMSL
ncbi:MAG: cytochrome-c peroxidase [Bacteroidales bacterium]|nr:cytochrome-c peroxidase [Bacteroidales bacterium]MCF8455340.1 cytochrome-c peroxidase [Bacteroidales bacterium]